MADLSKLERLLDLMAVLMNARFPLTFDQIKEELPEAAYRLDRPDLARFKFIRDKKDLEAVGVVIEDGMDPDRQVWGYTIDPSSFGMELPTLDARESASISIALAVMGDNLKSWQLGGAHADISTLPLIPRAHIPTDESVEVLLEAVTNATEVSFDYSGKARVVQPHQVAFIKGHWQMVGYDESRGEIRQFRRDRIESSVEGTNRRFTPPATPTLVRADHIWRAGDGEPQDVTVKVEARLAAWVERLLGPESVVERFEDGSILVVEQVRNFESFRSFLLTLLDGAELVGPAHLRHEMIAWLESMI
ncbi:MAG: hypothetical protein CL467_09500 [Acidimicrobiaceae bacterium]|nr:hypothetical protein [Acidimicrobiaceae bacterium]